MPRFAWNLFCSVGELLLERDELAPLRVGQAGAAALERGQPQLGELRLRRALGGAARLRVGERAVQVGARGDLAEHVARVGRALQRRLADRGVGGDVVEEALRREVVVEVRRRVLQRHHHARERARRRGARRRGRRARCSAAIDVAHEDAMRAGDSDQSIGSTAAAGLAAPRRRGGARA